MIQTLSDTKKAIALFALSWSENSSDQNFSTEYIREKNRYLSEPYLDDSLSPSATCLDSKSTLQKQKEKALGADRVSYPMLKNSPPKNKTFGYL